VSRPPQFSVEDKLRIVLSVLVGEMTSVAEAARRNKTSGTSVAKWKAQFLEGGKQGLVASARSSGASVREEQLEAEIAELHTALGEAHV
jgi:transposase